MISVIYLYDVLLSKGFCPKILKLKFQPMSGKVKLTFFFPNYHHPCLVYLIFEKHSAHNFISLELTTSLSSRFEKTKYLKCFWSHLIDQDCQGCYPYSRRKEKHLYDEKINQKTIRNEIGPKESV